MTLRQLIEKATPGPWEMEPHPADRTLHIYGPKPRCRLIAELSPESKHDGAELAANADLIARCSPSVMLAVVEALEAAKERIGQHRMSNYQHGAMEADAVDYDVQTKLFAALNALNGKAP